MKILTVASVYFQTISNLMSRPGDFFGGTRSESMIYSIKYLFVSILIFIMASMTLIRENHLSAAGILLINAVFMPFIMSIVSLLIIKMIGKKHVPFTNIFSVNAFASGTTILVSWIPLFLWISEPWKWTLIVIGYVRACGLNYRQAIVTMIITIIFIVLGFRMFLSVISNLRVGF
jgi:hypothetical protein